MFSPPICQPLVLEAVANVVSSVRSGCSGIIIPRGRQLRAASTQCRNKIQKSEAKLTKVNHADLEKCMEILLQRENLPKVAAMLGISHRKHWNDNYVSSPSFFENKTGFSEKMLFDNTLRSQSFTLFLKPEVRHLLHQTLSPVYIQTRGFKPQRKPSLGGGSKESQSIEKLLKNERPSTQDKIKLAFAEGVLKSSSTSTEPQTFSDRLKSLRTTFRYFFIYALLVYIFYQLLVLFSGNPRNDPAAGSFNLLGMNRMEVKPEEVNVTFADVRGCDEVKEELADIVTFLQEPEKFRKMGAKLPKGILMVGSPGVGKTLLAKAVAGEAGVPFFHASGSEFDELFVGSGAKRVRHLFSVAKAKAPSVVFIDEIDSVGAKRTSSQLHPYANQTINQLLSEMDGFAGESGVIVIGATNKKENLDQALLRPGRFDMEVHVMQPDFNGRKEIFELYLSKVKAAKDIDLSRLASLTFGMTGADIANVVNQAALFATLRGDDCVNMDHLDHARDKVTMGPAWKNRKTSDKAKLNTAYHEAGHAIVGYCTEAAMKLHKVTIIPRGGSLGHTAYLPEEDMTGRTKAQLLAEIDVAMGGRVGEQVIYGMDNVTTGASSDFQRATNIAKAMVKKLGMSNKVGARVYDDETLDGGSAFIKMNDISPDTQQVIDSEIDKILSESYERALKILKTHEKEHKALADALIKYETLSSEEVDLIMKGRTLKRKPIVPVDMRKTDNKPGTTTDSGKKLLS